MMPTRLDLDLAGGRARADRDRLLRLVLAVESGLEDGTASVAWKVLLDAAHWIADREAGVTR